MSLGIGGVIGHEVATALNGGYRLGEDANQLVTKLRRGKYAMTTYGPISLKLHAINDLVVLLFLLFSPWILGFSEYSDATTYTFALFFIGMGLTVITDYPLGVIKKLPFKWHRLVEVTSPPLFVIIPWYFFSDAGLMPWVASTVGALAVLNAVLTRPRTA
jgi:hypothetical protein